MKKVLIISYLYRPSNKMGAVRPTKLAKYISQNQEYEVNVITASSEDDLVDSIDIQCEHNISVTRLSHSKFVKNKIINNKALLYQNRQLGISKNKSNYFMGLFKVIFRFLKKTTIEYDFLNSFKRYVKKNYLDLIDADILITTFGPLSSVLCGISFKKKFKSVKWINDFRDPMVVDLRSKIENFLYYRVQKKSCKLADCIVTVSNGYMDRICDKCTINKAIVIPNGFDRDDIIDFCSLSQDEKFSFAYTGYLYGGKRDIRPLFQILRELINSKHMDTNDIIFYYAGNDYECLHNQAMEYDLVNILRDKGVLSREDSLRLQYSARYLVLSTWNYKSETGVFPGKFLEYMLMEKPIISIVSGELSNSEVSNVVRRGNLGISYEQGNHIEDIINLKQYIFEEYHRYKHKLKPYFHPQKEVIEKYNYENISKEFLAIF